MGRAVTVITAAFLMVGIANSAASANSPWIWSTSNDCVAAWYSGPNEFVIGDDDLNDGKGCAVLYSFFDDHTPSTWIWHPKDIEELRYYSVNNPSREQWIFFKVCDHRDREASNCTDWGRYAT
jgi:hypothetical protein